jgi:lipopolysaccharide transport system permease protein
MVDTQTRSAATIVIEPSRGLADFNLKEIWDYRDLMFFLAWRDINIRYKQTILGAAWAVVQPVMTMILFTIFFGRMAGVPSEGVPYPLFAFAALLPWQYFATTLGNAANSLVNNSNLLSKVYFPRLLIPLTSLFPPAVDFMIAFVVLIGLMFYYRQAPSVQVIWLPAFLILAMVTTLGAGLWFAAMNVKYRDVRHIVTVLVQFGHVRFTRGLSEPDRANAVAQSLCSQSYGRSDRRVSLGFAGNRRRAVTTNRYLFRGCGGVVHQRLLLFPIH